MVIYFDNNATTKCNIACREAINLWTKNPCNPSSDNEHAIEAKKLIDRFKKYVLSHLDTSCDQYTVVVTSGASEANSFIITACARSYKKLTHHVGHVIISATEHKSILETCALLHSYNELEYTIADVDNVGIVQLSELEKCFKKNTCLVSIMTANNELGSINPIQKIARLCHAKNIPFHTDNVQSFGKFKTPVRGIDALSMSFHKMYCGMGIGLLIMSNKLIEGYHLCSMIAGTQQDGLRGGTENAPAIAGAFAGMKQTFSGRSSKNKHLAYLRKMLIDGLPYRVEYIDGTPISRSPPRLVSAKIVILGPKSEDKVIPNTLLLSVVPLPSPREIGKKGEKVFCNVKLKHYLHKHNIYTSIGSACNTHSDKASHVLTAIGASKQIKQGVLRISFGDDNTEAEVARFLRVFTQAVEAQL